MHSFGHSYLTDGLTTHKSCCHQSFVNHIFRISDRLVSDWQLANSVLQEVDPDIGVFHVRKNPSLKSRMFYNFLSFGFKIQRNVNYLLFQWIVLFLLFPFVVQNIEHCKSPCCWLRRLSSLNGRHWVSVSIFISWFLGEAWVVDSVYAAVRLSRRERLLDRRRCLVMYDENHELNGDVVSKLLRV